ncbi:MAG: transposase zinc-binding domain-containing protein, partial [Alphaproteobacteria bacterium]
MEATVRGIFTNHFDAYSRTHPVPLHKHKAARALIDCRTAAMGGQVVRCPNGHIEEVHYNSCKNRSCPQCSALPTERWLDSVKSRLL